MLHALAENTAALRSDPGEIREFPDNTADALQSGAMQAICGAVEQMRRRIDTDPAQVRVYLAGGAREIAPHQSSGGVVDHLVLEGCLALPGSPARGGTLRRGRRRPPSRHPRHAHRRRSLLLANLVAGTRLDNAAAGGVRLKQQVRPDTIKLLSPQEVAALGPQGRGARRRLSRMGAVRRGRASARTGRHRAARARPAPYAKRVE
jgi:hypothetical protein